MCWSIEFQFQLNDFHIATISTFWFWLNRVLKYNFSIQMWDDTSNRCLNMNYMQKMRAINFIITVNAIKKWFIESAVKQFEFFLFIFAHWKPTLSVWLLTQFASPNIFAFLFISIFFSTFTNFELETWYLHIFFYSHAFGLW